MNKKESREYKGKKSISDLGESLNLHCEPDNFSNTLTVNHLKSCYDNYRISANEFDITQSDQKT